MIDKIEAKAFLKLKSFWTVFPACLENEIFIYPKKKN